jgi:hypothetical protein
MKKQVAFCNKCGTQLESGNYVHLNLCKGHEMNRGSTISVYNNYDFCCSCMSDILQGCEKLNDTLVGRQSLVSYLEELKIKEG